MKTMKVAIQEEWDAITGAEIEDIIFSMPKRIQALIKAKSGHIDYSMRIVLQFCNLYDKFVAFQI